MKIKMTKNSLNIEKVMNRMIKFVEIHFKIVNKIKSERIKFLIIILYNIVY